MVSRFFQSRIPNYLNNNTNPNAYSPKNQPTSSPKVAKPVFNYPQSTAVANKMIYTMQLAN